MLLATTVDSDLTAEPEEFLLLPHTEKNAF